MPPRSTRRDVAGTTGRAARAFTVPMPRTLPAEQQDAETWWCEVDGRRLRLSNLDKVFWPEEGYTKGDLLAYYFNVADRILPYLRDRPLTMKRMPDGAAGGYFYEKTAPPHTPGWIRGCAVEATGDGGRWGAPKDPRQYRSSREGSPAKDLIQYLMVDSVAALLFVANMGCIEFHPLHSRCGAAETPDYLFFDLDPFDVPFQTVLEVARLVKVVCDGFGLRSYPKTSGATGMQIYVPVRPDHTYAQVREFVGRAGHLIRRADPARVTMEWEIRNRTGRVFIDHNMNRQGANIAAVYSMRPEPGATVSTPVTWQEVEAGRIRPGDFTIATVWERFAPGADPFLPVLAADQDLHPALQALDIAEGDAAPPTRSFEVAMPPSDRPVPLAGDGGPHAREASEPPAGRGTRSRASERASERAQARAEASARATARSKDPKLGEYLSMRSFGDQGTPEPAAGGPTPQGDLFVIQKHDATRIHYDLRLERDGVLVSWAVPKGLPLVKGERHLAVHTEDHPIEYAWFEGPIPKGHYGAGDVRIWDRGRYEEVEWTDTKVSFRLYGERFDGQEYHLVKTSRDWLVFMASRSPEAAPGAPPAFSPMLAESVPDPFDDAAWAFEPKLDGVRCLVHIEMNATRLVSRTGRDQTKQYPELSRVHERVTAENAVLDGEIVAFDASGRPSFQRLQQRMNLSSPADVERARREVPVQLFVFDVLWLDGEDLTGRPWSERRRRLEEVVVEGKGIAATLAVTEHGRALWESARERGLEGIIAKRIASRYLPGRRSGDWRKIKIVSRDEFVVIGWTPGQGGRGGAFGALLLGAYGDGDLHWVGQVGTGFTDRMLRDMMGRLRALEADAPPSADPELRKVKGARWVRPELVATVEYLERTEGGRKLRAPSFKGLRDDIDPRDCVLPAREG